MENNVFLVAMISKVISYLHWCDISMIYIVALLLFCSKSKALFFLILGLRIFFQNIKVGGGKKKKKKITKNFFFI